MKRVLLLMALFISGFVGAAVAAPIDVKIGVLTDMTAFLSEATGPGSLTAAELAADDARKLYPDLKITVVSADHQNKADVGSAIARNWFDNEKVDVAIDLTNSAVGIAVFDLGRTRKKITISTVGSSVLTEKYCSETGIQWTMDTYTYAKSITKPMVEAGGDTWYFVTVDYAGGKGLEDSMTEFVKAAGGRVIGSTRHPPNTMDFSSYLLSAQSSGAKVIGLANAGGDATNSIKQANEFGITAKGQILAAPTLFDTDIHSLGLEAAQGVRFGTPFYWAMNPEAKAWSERFFAKMKKMPTHAQAGVYTALLHYFKAVNATKSSDGLVVAAKMRELPITDFMTKAGKIRVNGSVMRERMLMEVKKPSESKGPWDYAKVVKLLNPEESAPRDLAATGCSLAK